MATTPHKHSVKPAATASHKAARPQPELSPADLAAMVPVEGLPQFKSVNLDKRYVPARLPTGKVMEVWGEALIRTPDGGVRQLVTGDEIKKGDVILTAQDGIVQMEADGSRFARQPFGADMQGPLAQVNAQDEMDATGAGQGDVGSLSDAMRIDRVVEQVSGQEFQFGASTRLLGAVTAGNELPQVLDAGNRHTVLDLQNVLVPESGVIIASGVQAAAVAGTPGFAVFTVHLDTPSIETIQLALKLTPGTATLGTLAQRGDFGSTSDPFQGMQVSVDDGKTWVGADSVTVPIGVTQALVRVPVTSDTIDEFDETFTLTATRTSPGAEAVIMLATATIIDDDPPPSISSNAVSVIESAGTAQVMLTLSTESGKPISVNWTTADGVGPTGAIAGQDYTASSGTVTFAPGETSKTISVPILSDKVAEPTEQFTINLSNGVNVDIPTAQSVVTILDDDHAPTLVHQNPTPKDEDVVQTGNVLAGAQDADGDPVRVVSVTVDPITIGNTTIPSQTAAAGQPITISGVGTVVIDPNGNYTFTPVLNYDGKVPLIHYTASDSANPVTETIQLAIIPVNDAPVVAAATAATVSELGLASVLAATGNPVVATGTVSIQDPDNTSFTIRLEAPTAPVTVGGLALGWSGAGTVGSPLVGSIDGKDYLRASMANDGSYKVDLLGAIDNVVNPNGSSKTVDFKYFVSDGFVADNIHNRLVEVPGTLSVNVIDDTPHLSAQQPTATVARSDSNLVIMLDTSGSMNAADGFGGTGTRLNSAVLSIKSMLDEYAKQGNVQVQLITFSTTAHLASSQWVDVTTAKAELDAVQPDNGGTNYAPAMTAAINAVTLSPASANPGAKNFAYMFSDGGSDPQNPVTAGQISQWESFLNDHSMKSVAIGLGSSTITPLQALNALSPIAYDGALHVNTDPVVVNSVTDLTQQLAGTIPAQLHGFLAGTATSGVAGGADTAHISSVTVDDGKPAHTFDGAHAAAGSGIDPISNVLTVTTNKFGTLTIDMDDGSYGYQPPTTINQPYTESITFTVTDRDGSSTPSSLVINVPATATGQQVHVGTASALSASTSVGETLHATPLADVFSWTLADAGAPGSPSVTHITGFGTASASQNGDTLDLRDLLLGELAGPQGTVGNLGHYLDFSVNGSGAQASTTLQISSHGGFDPALGAAGTALADKTIVLDGVDLRGSLGLDAHAANQQIIESLLQHGKLVVDGTA